MGEPTTAGFAQAGRIIIAIFAIAAFTGGFILMGQAFHGAAHSAWIFVAGLGLSCFAIFAGIQFAGSHEDTADDDSAHL